MVSLSKGQKVNLTKDNPGLSKIIVGLGWDTNKYEGKAFDLDASAFLLTGGRCLAEHDFVFYGSTAKTPEGKAILADDSYSVIHQGDNLTGEGDGDDEVINVDLSLVPASKDRIEFVATIYDADARKQNFGMVTNAYIRLVNSDTGVELMRYDLGEDASTETALKFAAMYRHNGEWKFEAIGAGYAGGLVSLCNEYGINAG